MLTNFFTDINLNTNTNSAVPSASQKEFSAITDYRTGRKIAQQSVNTGIKPCLLKRIAKKISLYYRIIKKCTIISYYFVKHAVFRGPIDTPSKIDNLLQALGPTVVKTFQPLFDNDLFVKVFINLANNSYENIFSKENEKNIAPLMSALRKPLNNNKCKISIDDAQNILNKNFGDQYTVNEKLGVGTIAACFGVTNKEGVNAVAKLVMDDSIDDIEISKATVKFISYLLFLSKGELVRKITVGLNNYIHEGDLEQESNNQSNYKDLVNFASSGNEITIDNQKISETPLTLKCSFYVPDIMERSREAIVMEKIDGFPLSTLKSPPCNLESLKPKIEELIDSSLNEDQFNKIMPELVSAITKECHKKWLKILDEKGVAHGDLHSGNIMVSFDKEITISFLDHPRNIQVDSGLNNFLKSYVETVNKFTEIVPPKNMEIDTEDEKLYPGALCLFSMAKYLFESFHNPSETCMTNIPSEELEIVHNLYEHLTQKSDFQGDYHKDPEPQVEESVLEYIHRTLIVFRLLGGRKEIDPELGTLLDKALFIMLQVTKISTPSALDDLFRALDRGGIFYNPD